MCVMRDSRSWTCAGPSRPPTACSRRSLSRADGGMNESESRDSHPKSRLLVDPSNPRTSQRRRERARRGPHQARLGQVKVALQVVHRARLPGVCVCVCVCVCVYVCICVCVFCVCVCVCVCVCCVE